MNRTHDWAAAEDDEPELLRDQFRQLLRYRLLVASGVAVGLLGGAWLGLNSADSYAATSDVVLRTPTSDPFNPAISVDKTVNAGSERQIALSSSVADQAAKKLGLDNGADALEGNLQVTNPPQSMVLRFTYTGSSPTEASRRANALTRAYLDLRRKQSTSQRDTMIKGYRSQLEPVSEQHNQVAEEIEGLPDGPAADAAYAVKSNLLSRMTELRARISDLEALDMTPGAVIRPAVAPSAPAGPGLPMLLGLGAAVGVALGLLAAWVRLLFDPAPRSANDVARAIRAPVLGALRRGATRAMLAGDQADPRMAEEYRSVAFRLAYDERFAHRRRLLVVAPRGSGAPAAAVASNLAASFAETGKDVLLIEADLRTPSLADRLRAHAADGRPRWSLPADTDESGWPGTRQLRVDTGESGTFDLVPGQRVRNVARALTSSRATRLIEEADSPNATVVVLAPPVLSYADTLALVDRVDGVLIVCHPRAVHRADLARIRELVAGAGGTVLGAVTHLDPEQSDGRGRGRNSGHSKARSAHRPQPDDWKGPADDGDTMALRTVRAGER